jgi:hypothetical protein
MHIDSSTGNVGIGTTSPGAKLDVSAGTNLNLGIRQLTLDNFSDEGIGMTFSRTSSDADLMAIGVASADKLGVFSRSGIIFSTGGLVQYAQTEERMRIDLDGNVGIGTDSPSQIFTIENNSGFFRINTSTSTYPRIEVGSASGSTAAIINRITGSQNIVFGESSDSGNYIFRGGNVGIGTTSPGTKLEVYDGDIKLNDSTRNLLIGEEGSSSYQIKSSGYLIVDATSGIQINKTTSGNVTIGSGNVGIGTTSPNAALQINGGTSNNSNRSNVALFTGNNAGGLVDALGLINGATATFGNAVALNFHNASNYSPTGAIRVYQVSSGTITDASMRFYTYQDGLTEKMRITSAGNVGS